MVSDSDTIKTHATNIGNALHTGLPYKAKLDRNSGLRLVTRELNRHNIKLSDVIMSGNIDIEVK